MDPLSPWSHLCPDMLCDEIANRLHSDIDLLCLRAVCRSWRFLLPEPCRSPPHKLPFPMGPSPYMNLLDTGSLYLVHSTVYCLQPLKKPTQTSNTTKCWLIKIAKTNEPPKILLKDPLSLGTADSDSLGLSLRLPNGLNLLDYRVSEITKVYDLQFVGDKKINETKFPERFSVKAKKVAVCSEGPAFAVMAIHNYGQLSIWTEGDKEWTPLGNPPCGAIYHDVVYHNGKFYARDTYGATISIDILSKKIDAQITEAMGDTGEKRLLSYLGDLFLLDWDFFPERWEAPSWNSVFDPPTRFLVHKWNEVERQCVWMRSLENTVFVGDNCSFVVSAQECGGGCKNNCIYCMERFITLHFENPPPGSHAVLFDMEVSSAKFLSQVVGYSGLFWPPPSWLVT